MIGHQQQGPLLAVNDGQVLDIDLEHTETVQTAPEKTEGAPSPALASRTLARAWGAQPNEESHDRPAQQHTTGQQAGDGPAAGVRASSAQALAVVPGDRIAGLDFRIKATLQGVPVCQIGKRSS